MSFITVRYADNKSSIFNRNCKNNILLDHIKQRCGLPPTDLIDLSDEEGHVKQLHDNLDDYGINFLEDREILVLLRVNKVAKDEICANKDQDESKHKLEVLYTPLLDVGEESVSFLAALNPSQYKNGRGRNRKYDGGARRGNELRPRLKI